MSYQTSSGNYFKFTRNYNVSGLTICAWAYPTTIGSGEITICANSPDQTLLSILASGAPIAVITASSTRFAFGFGTTISANVWTHMALTYNGTDTRLYVNGTQAGSSSAAFSAINSSTNPHGVGALGNGNNPFPGYLAELATWTRALNASEVASLAKGFKPSRIPKPEIYYPLVREKIDVGSNYTLTTTGSPSAQPHPRVY